MEEICFNSALMREMRVIAMFTQMIDDGKMRGNKRMFFHLIDALCSMAQGWRMGPAYEALDCGSLRWVSSMRSFSLLSISVETRWAARDRVPICLQNLARRRVGHQCLL